MESANGQNLSRPIWIISLFYPTVCELLCCRLYKKERYTENCYLKIARNIPSYNQDVKFESQQN